MRSGINLSSVNSASSVSSVSSVSSANGVDNVNDVDSVNSVNSLNSENIVNSSKRSASSISDGILLFGNKAKINKYSSLTSIFLSNEHLFI